MHAQPTHLHLHLINTPVGAGSMLVVAFEIQYHSSPENSFYFQITVLQI
jgi:hypothetical protein